MTKASGKLQQIHNYGLEAKHHSEQETRHFTADGRKGLSGALPPLHAREEEPRLGVFPPDAAQRAGVSRVRANVFH